MNARTYAIRRSEPADADGVSRVLDACYTPLLAPAYDSRLLRRALPTITTANKTLLASKRFYVAETADGTLIGCGGWSNDYPDESEVLPERGYVRHFATHPDWLHCGVGRAIYARCEADAVDAGVRHLICHSSLNGEGFYAAVGFVRIRHAEIGLPKGLIMPVVLMQKTLA